MKKLLKFLCGRIFITGLLLLLQAVWLGVFFWKLAAYSVWLNAAFTLLSLLIVLHILYHDDVSGFKIGWIILILQLPVMGGLLYLLFGGKLPAHRMRRRLAAQHAETAAALGQDEAVFGALRGDDARAAARSRYITATGGYPVCMDSDVKYYPLGEEMYADMLRALESAEHFIFLEYFIIQPGKMWDGIAEILKRKAAQGVDVRLICDDMGSLFLLPQGFAREMERSGVKTLMFNPFIPVLSLAMNNRDHRKIMDVDGHTVFTGGVNLSDEYINAVELHGHWKDTGVRVTGEAAWNFTAMFLEFWHAYRPESANEPLDAVRPHAYHPAPFAGEGWVQPFSDSPLDGEAVSAGVYIDILAQARDYVYIFTPYLIIDDVMQAALCAAAKRGVDVRIVTPGVPDKKVVYRLTRSYYAPLLRAGVRIYEYTPGFIHAKSYLSDDTTGVVGTINMDYRSLYLHFECGTYLYRTPALQALKADVMDTLAKSREISPADCRRHFWSRMLDAVLRIAAPLC